MSFRQAWFSSELQSSKLHSETLSQKTNQNKTKNQKQEENSLLDLVLGWKPKDTLETVLNLF